ncbi:MAG: hypothetical protein KGI54_15435 [Pseudomonadota bacterium]|nr:hypothetical protein [Pseudomonadota bacterium]
MTTDTLELNDEAVFDIMAAADFIKKYGPRTFIGQLQYLYPHRYDELKHAFQFENVGVLLGEK